MNAKPLTSLAWVALFWLAGPHLAPGQSLPPPLPQGSLISETAAKPTATRPLKQATGRRPSATPGNVFPKEPAYRPTANPAAYSALQLRPFQLEGQNNGSRAVDPRRPGPYQGTPRTAAQFGAGVGLAGRSVAPQSQVDRLNSLGAGGGRMGMGGPGYGSGRNSISLGFFMGGLGGVSGAGNNGFVLFGVR